MTNNAKSRAWPLDLLRIFAALIVLAHHWEAYGVGSLLGSGVGHVLTTYGYMGVDVFFFISGLVITKSAMGRKSTDFMIARFSRLAPAYLLVLIVTLIVDAYVHDPRLSLQSVVSSLTFSEYVVGTSTDSLMILVAWTLWIEIQFYFVIALVLLIGAVPAVRSRLSGQFPLLAQLRWVFLIWLALVSLAMSGVITLPGLLLLNGYAPVFLCGALFGTVTSISQMRRLWSFLTLSVVLMWFAFIDRANSAGSQIAGLDSVTAVPVVSTVLVGLCLIAAVSSLSTRGLTGRTGRWVTLGAMATYPLYLMHQELGNRLLIGLQTNVGLPIWLSVLIAFGVVCAVSMFISARIEPPARRWITQSFKRDQARDASAQSMTNPVG